MRLSLALVFSLMTVSPLLAQTPAPDAAAPAPAPVAPVAPTEKDEKEALGLLSYMIGFQMGGETAENGISIDAQQLAAGLADGAAGKNPMYTSVQARQAMMTIQMAKRNQQEKQAADNKPQGEAFLAKNKTVEGVQTTATGLQYKVLVKGPGVGPKPKATDVVTVNYKGTLIDGSEFDSSYKRGEPASFPLNRVIPAWTEGVQLMQIGDKYQFVVPSQLGYGKNGSGKRIPPESVLVFEVELLKIEAAPSAEGMPAFPGAGSAEPAPAH